MDEIKTYTHLSTIVKFDRRFEYLQLFGTPGKVTFGGLRELNQVFYKSSTWRAVRDHVITRDHGYDLGVHGYDIFGTVYVHHMNPITPDTLIHSQHLALDPEFLITVSFDTHQSIHFGRKQMVTLLERRPGDTSLW